MTDPNTDTVELTLEFEAPMTAEKLEERFRELADQMAEVQQNRDDESQEQQLRNRDNSYR